MAKVKKASSTDHDSVRSGGSSSDHTSKRRIALTYVRPDSISTTELPRADIDHNVIQKYLKLNGQDMKRAEQILNQIVTENPELSTIKLRANKDKEHLCDIINQYTDRFNGHLGTRLRQMDESPDVVGWMLYQLAIGCIKTQGHATPSFPSSLEKGKTNAPLFKDGPRGPMGQRRPSLSAKTTSDDEISKYGFSLSHETPSKSRIDWSDVEREVSILEEADKKKQQRGASAEIKITRRRRGRGVTAAGNTDGAVDSDDEGCLSCISESNRTSVICIIVCMVIALLIINIMTAASILHSKRGQEKLWQSVIPRDVTSIVHASAKTISSSESSK
ncbi:hypothetical protein ABW21_db0207971 [Orbilia brochopaga]|nr:hypothetical protein ABW21_db0207971 [Drechslerella brochopaga]